MNQRKEYKCGKIVTKNSTGYSTLRMLRTLQISRDASGRCNVSLQFTVTWYFAVAPAPLTSRYLK